MLPYDFDMEENINSYPIYQQSNFKPTLLDSNMMSSNDIWQSSPSSNSNTNYQSYYVPSSFDSKEYQTIENHHFNYQSTFDHSSTSRITPYSYAFPNNCSVVESYSTQTGYNSPSIESSIYFTPTDSYHNIHSIYTDPNVILPSSASPQWNFDLNKTSMNNGMHSCSTTNSIKQPCVVCQEESSGYHFGAYTCESCKAFYRRVTKGNIDKPKPSPSSVVHRSSYCNQTFL